MSFTVAIGLGLSEAALGQDPHDAAGPHHIGRAESERLLGVGREYGRGPLPTFLERFDVARRAGAPLGLIVVREAFEQTGDSVGQSGVASLAPFVQEAEFVCAAQSSGALWRPLLHAIRRVSGINPLADDGGERLRFLLVGCQTEHRVLATALFLRSILGHDHVATSPHLVGSATSEAHLAALRHHLPRAGVEVLLQLGDAAEFAGLEREPFANLGRTACVIEPANIGEELGETSRRIVQLLCLHWTKAELRLLNGGFSGSVLLLADGWKDQACTEPMVIKVDRYSQMRREIDGYHMVKDLLGKHVPTFEYPVSVGDSTGVGMDLATMEGAPISLQEAFENADSDDAVAHFLRRLDKALDLLSTRLYRNTRCAEWVSPYRALHLHADVQRQWLAENLDAIRQHWTADTDAPLAVDGVHLAKLLRVLARNDDGVESEVCLAHGDLNFKNIICDRGDNIWLIDWTHCGRMPIEVDFAKLESDLKIVMSKQFELEDLSRVRQLEDYLLANRLPSTVDQLPESLRFVRWDLRFRKILMGVEHIRRACFDLKRGDDWLVYRAALLKYALHSLSFDARRGRGECELPQLLYALHCVEALLHDLVVDDFQLKIRGERPPSYPPRQRVSIDLAPWSVDCPEYDPPYHVDAAVLAHDRASIDGGLADPEDPSLIADDVAASSPFRDAAGRPLHPHGRTGIAGRGALPRWGPNLAVVALLTRDRANGGGTDILLGKCAESESLHLPEGLVHAGESAECALGRVVERDIGWRPARESMPLAEGYSYDIRRTDHAWIVASARHLHMTHDEAPKLFQLGGRFEAVSWYPLDANTVNRIPAEHARHARAAIRALERTCHIDGAVASAVLAATG